MLAPFLQVIFNVTDTVNNQITSRFAVGPIHTFYDWLTQLVNTQDGKVKALGSDLYRCRNRYYLKKSFRLPGAVCFESYPKQYH
jgi:hypothetical protein